MVPIVRPVWQRVGQANQLGCRFPALTYAAQDAADLTMLEPAPRTVAGARDLLSVGLQYGTAFGRGFQAAALKPADFFGDDDVLYLMEDMATGEIRLSMLWEWLHKGAKFTADDSKVGVCAGDGFTRELLDRLIDEEYTKLRAASNHDVHDDSKATTLPIAHAICGGISEQRRQATLVHRSAQPESRQPRPGSRPRSDCSIPHGIQAQRHAHDRQPRLRHGGAGLRRS